MKEDRRGEAEAVDPVEDAGVTLHQSGYTYTTAVTPGKLMVSEVDRAVLKRAVRPESPLFALLPGFQSNGTLNTTLFDERLRAYMKNWSGRNGEIGRAHV